MKKDAMEEKEALDGMADDLASRNRQLRTALEACKTLQARLGLAEQVATALGAVLDTPEAVYPFSLTATFTKAVGQARTVLADFQAHDGGIDLLARHQAEVRGQLEALTRRNLELEAELAEYAATLSEALRRLQALDAEYQALLADIEAGEETDAGAFSVPIAREFTSQTRLTDFPWFRALEARAEQVEILPEEVKA